MNRTMIGLFSHYPDCHLKISLTLKETKRISRNGFLKKQLIQVWGRNEPDEPGSSCVFAGNARTEQYFELYVSVQ